MRQNAALCGNGLIVNSIPLPICICWKHLTVSLSFFYSVNELEVFSDTNTLIRIISTGQALWSPGGIFETYCEADITYYPLDIQECTYVSVFVELFLSEVGYRPSKSWHGSEIHTINFSEVVWVRGLSFCDRIEFVM